MKFDEIIGQLRSISNAEHLTVDDDALAMLAEAGDGSMRDALSIMDQAISCCGTTLTADLVRGLIGSVSSDVLEQVMHAVHGDSSEEVLRIVDKLITEGHSATHFVKQFVRFLRNAIVAKVAGGESSLLQISSDEKQRVLRIAELFTEEDLTRFLQITLRTHGDVNFKQEQRFHLELGMLKLVHAKRMLPLEELLSGAKLENSSAAGSAPSGSGAARTTPPSLSAPRSAPPSLGGRPTPSPSGSLGGSRPATPAARPSPFEADKARKCRPIFRRRRKLRRQCDAESGCASSGEYDGESVSDSDGGNASNDDECLSAETSTGESRGSDDDSRAARYGRRGCDRAGCHRDGKRYERRSGT